MDIYICITDHFTVYLKLALHCKSTRFPFFLIQQTIEYNKKQTHRYRNKLVVTSAEEGEAIGLGELEVQTIF